MIAEIYSESIKIMVYIVAVFIAISLVYFVLTEGADPIIMEQTGAYEQTLNASTEQVFNMINNPEMFSSTP